jgi:hypothetical protein
MRWSLALWGACSLCLACGGKAAQNSDSRAQPAKACFALSDALGPAELAQQAEEKLGISLSSATLDASSADGFVRAQQLVDDVEAALRGGSPPATARELLRGFLTKQFLTQPSVAGAAPTSPPTLDPGIAAAMAGELERFTDHWMVENQGTLASLLTDDTTQLTLELANHYGVAYPFDSDWSPIQQPTAERAGLLTLGAFLTRLDFFPARSMQLSQAMSCLTIPVPPAFPDSVWDEPVRPPAKQIVVETYGAEVTCESCHQYYVGYGIALDRYDELGRYRDTLGGSRIDTDYYVELSSNVELPKPDAATRLEFGNPQELGQALSTAPQVRVCLTQKLNEYWGGSALSDAELACVLAELDERQASLWSLLAALLPHVVRR